MTKEQHMPDQTHIPVGLATKLGAAIAAILGAATIIQAFLDGDHSDTTIATLAGLVLTVYKIMDGRYNQATAVIASDAVAAVVDASGDDDMPDAGAVPDDASLRNQFGSDVPFSGAIPEGATDIPKPPKS